MSADRTRGPSPLARALLARTPSSLKRLFFAGSGAHCPVCDSDIRGFLPWGERARAQCPVCGTMERHRLAWLFFRRRTDLMDGRPKRMLHIAPEPGVASRLSRVPGLDHVTGDLDPSHADVRMDVTDIPFPDGHFDVVYCSHVLEHVPDDRRALAEFARVLAPGGWALVLVPVTAERTVEDPTATSPEERRRLFGQHDHVRRYGPDVAKRFAEPGFTVTQHPRRDVANDAEAARLGLDVEDTLYLLRR